MGKKGAKKKTRWRTLSIGTPLGEEVEEDGLKRGYEKVQENGTSSRNAEKAIQAGYKVRRNGTGNQNSNYGSGGSKSRRGDDSTRSPSHSKIIFNEEEYTRITTPRQDVLFKKGYLSQKKPWTGITSTSATPSTTESQSASHSTADGSEAAEDQQLLDSSTGEYAPMMEPPPQLGYGTFYDHNSGFYYEYPVMLVGPPVPEQINPNYLAAMSCNPVPLRPIEWVNPTFVPKISDQQYCLMDYQSEQNTDCAVVIDVRDESVPVDAMNGINDSGAGSASCSGSAEEELTDEQGEEQVEDHESYNGTFVDTSLTQPVPLPHIVPPVPQPYLYPGHYMFGPQLVNVNGMTIQSGTPMMRCSEVMITNTSAACVKRRKKKKRRKNIRLPTPENAQNNDDRDNDDEDEDDDDDDNDDEEEEEDEEVEEQKLQQGQEQKQADDGIEDYTLKAEKSSSSSSWIQWPSGQNKLGQQSQSTTFSNRPLNPECQEFQLRTALMESSNGSQTASTTVTEFVSSDSSATNNAEESQSSNPQVLKDVVNGEPKRLKREKAKKQNKADITPSYAKEYAPDDGNTTAVTAVLSSSETNPKTIVWEKKCSRAPSPEINRTTIPINAETQRLPESYESLITRNQNLRQKYSKSPKFVREATPASDLKILENEQNENEQQQVEATIHIQENGGSISESYNNENNEGSSNEEKVVHQDDGSCEDSGFESQTRTKSKRPITDAVNEWLRRANSPDLFLTNFSTVSDSKGEEDNEDDEDDVDYDDDDEKEEDEMPKNLQGNPMPALSVNGSADDLTSSRLASCGKFARSNCARKEYLLTKIERMKRKRRRSKNSKRRSENVDDHKKLGSHDGTQEKEVAKIALPFSGGIGVDCEFTEEDSVAGMRVALSSRINTKRRKKNQMKDLMKSDLNPESDRINARIVQVQNDAKKALLGDALAVKTFESGQVVVSIEGKLLPVTKFEPFLHSSDIVEGNMLDESITSSSALKEAMSSSSSSNENAAALTDSIEEPDVLEYWEAETIEFITTPKRKANVKDSVDDAFELDPSIECVQKYYKLAQGSMTSLQDEPIDSKLISNSPTPMIESSVCSEESLPAFYSMRKPSPPIEEAFEVYESCYNSKTHIFHSSKFLAGDQEDTVPCRIVCCNIQ